MLDSATDDISAKEPDLDQEEAALRAEAEAISPARPEDTTIPDEKSEAEERASAREKQTSKKNARPDSAKSSAATDAAKSATTSKGTEPAKQTPAEPKQPTPTHPETIDESKLTPFQKERRRLDQTWKQVQAEKDAIRQEREQIAQQRRQWEQQQRQTPAAPKADGPTAADYEAIAADYEAEGKIALAQKAKAKAAELHKQEAATQQPAQTAGPRERYTPEEQKQMASEWSANLEKAGKENPDLTQEGTPLRTRVSELLRTHPELHTSGAGITLAVEIAKAELKAKQADEWQAKVTELEAKVKELTELTALPSGHATPASKTAKFDDLSLDEQEAALRNEASSG